MLRAFAITLLAFSSLALGQIEAVPASDEPLELWVRSGELGIAVYQSMIDMYTEQTGQEISLTASTTDFEERLLRAASGNNLPDIVINDTAFRGQLVDFGLVEPVERENVQGNGDILERAWEAAKGSDGTYYGVPTSTQAFILLIRKDWREALGRDLPTNWDEMVSLAQAFTTEDPDGNGRDDTYGFLVPGSTTRGYASWFWQTFLWESGGDYMEPVGDGTFRPTLNSEAALSALTWLQNLQCEAKVVQPGAVTAVSSDINADFESGVAGMLYIGPYAFPRFDENPGADSYEVVQLPAGPDNGAVLAEGENAYLMKGTPRYDQALAFAAWVASPDGQVAGMNAGGPNVVRLPINKTVDAGTIYDDPRWTTVQSAFSDSGRFVQPVPSWTPFRAGVSETVNAALANCSADPAALLEDGNELVRQELESQGVLASE